MGLTLSPMTAADVPEVAAMERLCFAVPWSESALLAETRKDDASFLTARLDGALCGYGGFNYVLDEGYIANIAVHPDFRRRGVARLLLDALCARGEALGLRFLTLEVRESNLAARELYTQTGFMPVGRRKNFYEAPREDAILMTKYFKQPVSRPDSKVADGTSAAAAGEIRRNKMKIEAVIFDMDGLMLDTEKIYMMTSLMAEEELGLHPSEELAKRTMGMNNASWRAAVSEFYGPSLDINDFALRCDRLMDEWFDDREIPVKPGLFQLLDFLRAEGIPCAVATSTREEKAMEMLRKVGAEGYFAGFVCGNMVEHSKPAPDIFLAAAKLLGKAPERCMGLEDSFNGLRASKAAGLYTVMVPDQNQPTEEILQLVDGCVPTLHEIIPLVERLNGL